MDVKQIIKEIDSLPVEGKVEIYSHLTEKLKSRDKILKALEEFRGIGKGIWDIDAQEYINQERANDRF